MDNNYLSVTEYAGAVDRDVATIRKMAIAGRIPAIKIGNQWAIPADTVLPEDRRIKSGKYVKSNKQE